MKQIIKQYGWSLSLISFSAALTAFNKVDAEAFVFILTVIGSVQLIFDRLFPKANQDDAVASIQLQLNSLASTLPTEGNMKAFNEGLSNQVGLINSSLSTIQKGISHIIVAAGLDGAATNQGGKK